MKLYKLIYLAAITVAAISCGKEENNRNPQTPEPGDVP